MARSTGCSGATGLGLIYFDYDDSGLCAPADDEFTAWLEGITTVVGSARCAVVPVMPGLGSLLLSILLAGFGARGLRRLSAVVENRRL